MQAFETAHSRQLLNGLNIIMAPLMQARNELQPTTAPTHCFSMQHHCVYRAEGKTCDCSAAPANVPRLQLQPARLACACRLYRPRPMRLTMLAGCLLSRSGTKKKSRSDAHMTRHALTSLLLTRI